MIADDKPDTSEGSDSIVRQAESVGSASESRLASLTSAGSRFPAPVGLRRRRERAEEWEERGDEPEDECRELRARLRMPAVWVHWRGSWFVGGQWGETACGEGEERECQLRLELIR